MPLIFRIEASGPWPPFDSRRKRAQFGEFKRKQIDFDLGDRAGEHRVVDQFLAAVQFGGGEFLQPFDAALKELTDLAEFTMKTWPDKAEADDARIALGQSNLVQGDFQKAIEQVAQMMLQDANSVAHICQTIVRDPGVFSPYKNRFIGGMLNSLPRLGLPPNCPLESRVLSVDVVELLVEWINNGATLPQSVIIGHMETIANFLVRLRMAMAEPLDGRSSKMDAGAVRLDHRVKHLFEKVLGTWKGTI
ncbi:MAG: hypothetical protein HC938_15805, partial [Nitrospira sp.]|nr:hypothetical protein [Nitrospira sp.]